MDDPPVLPAVNPTLVKARDVLGPVSCLIMPSRPAAGCILLLPTGCGNRAGKALGSDLLLLAALPPVAAVGAGGAPEPLRLLPLWKLDDIGLKLDAEYLNCW